jgi:hypothetical protein
VALHSVYQTQQLEPEPGGAFDIVGKSEGRENGTKPIGKMVSLEFGENNGSWEKI